MPNVQLCHWSSQLFDFCMLLSTDVPVLLLNQPINKLGTPLGKCGLKKKQRAEKFSPHSQGLKKVLSGSPRQVNFLAGY